LLDDAGLKLDQRFEANHVTYLRREGSFHWKSSGESRLQKVKEKKKVNLMRLKFDGIMIMHYVSKERTCGG